MRATRPNSRTTLTSRRCAGAWFIAVGVVCGMGHATAQETPAQPGLNLGNYNLQQSIELGWRYADFSGNRSVADTFVNLHTGPRLLAQTLDVHSLNHHGPIFDSLSVRSSGYGGEANDYTRLRADKNKWYKFNADFRRDQNRWDYNLLANPLNPPTSIPFIPVRQSPHRFLTVRRMSDFNLKIAPQSRVSLRLGYARHEHEGPSFSTFHKGVFGSGMETLLAQSLRSISNQYLIGADLKLLPRTNLSFDQFLDFHKSDTSWLDGNAAFTLSNGVPVDLGLVFNSDFPTCGPLFDPANPSAPNPLCNGFLAYSRSAPTRSSFPTGQLAFQSRYFRHMELTGRVAYSSGESRVRSFRELFQGLIVPTDERQFTTATSSNTRRLLTSVDWGAVWQVNERFRILETFRFSNLRIPGLAQTVVSTLFGYSLLIAPNVFSASSCPAPFTAATCPQHSPVSPSDEDNIRSAGFLGEEAKSQQLQVEHDFHRHAGARLGYRYRDRLIVTRMLSVTNSRFFPDQPNRGACAGIPLDANGVCSVSSSVGETDRVPIHENALLAGLWLQPIDAWRSNFDLEWSGADRSYTRISPRRRQHYRFRTAYAPSPQVNLSFAFTIHQQGNSSQQIRGWQHFHNYNFNATLALDRSLSLDLGYEYSGIHTQTDICIVSSALPSDALPCALGIGLFHQNSFYDSRSHFGHFALEWSPVKRVTADVGYDLTRESGNTLFLNPLSPPGSLRYDFHQPSALLAVELHRNWRWRAQWGYHGYNERGTPGPVTRRDFRGNVVTTALRYAF